jgi:hypothetical protein
MAAQPARQHLAPAIAMITPKSRAAAALLAASAIAVAGGCGIQDAAGSGSSSASGGELPQTSESVDLDPSAFSTTIDNRYWPMEPGTRWVYREVDDSGEQLRVVVTVTSATKAIANGVTARVVRDTVTQGGELVEDTLDWYAQDDDGNIWYLGEKTAEFENGQLASREGSFEAGVDGAMAGVAMPAEPADGLSYRQEFDKGNAEDRAEVLSRAEMAEVAAGHFDHAVLTKDTTPLEPRILEYKFYARGVGPVLVLGVSGGVVREELVGTTTVSPEVARAAAQAPLGQPYG